LEIKRSFKLAKKNTDSEPVLYENDDIPYWVERLMDTPVGKVRVVNTKLETRDQLDGCKARWGINRHNYKVSPGIYAVGQPDSKAEVLVTANYKLTFDMLRKELSGRNLWIVVIDTKGINVWCAAGKGTFGTSEVISRIRKTQLEKIVELRRIILPQLGAPGVAAHTVAKMTGFRVVYGPIYARDLGSYLDAGLKTEESMREVKFDFYDRLVLTPIEIVSILKYIPIIVITFIVLNMVRLDEVGLGKEITISMLNSVPYFLALFAGAFLFPLLLPYLPFHAFSLKGTILGVVLSAITIVFCDFFQYDKSVFLYLGNSLLITGIVAFLSLNFTGCTTYTSLSGVKLETKWTTIIAGISGIIGVLLLIANSVIKLVG
jgi:hypothetical protein